MPSTLTKLQIFNYALIKIGDATIASPTENTPRAKTLNTLYDNIRDDLLRRSPWNFAKKQASLASNGNTPTYRWLYEYPIPADMVKLLETENQWPYEIQGRLILSDATTPLKITYIARITDETLFDPMFSNALQTRLAYEASLRLTSDLSLQRVLRAQVTELETEAKAEDGKEADPREPHTYGWEDARW